MLAFHLVGPDEFYSHLVEGEHLPDSLPGRVFRHLGLLTERTRTDIFPPLPRGTLGTFIPRPQRCYLGFGDPLDLSRYKGKTPALKTLLSLREQTAQQIQQQLGELMVLREQQRGEESLLRRVLTL